jgi:hypothetical protein
MKKIFLILTLITAFYFIGCDKVTNPEDSLGNITAAQKVDEVLQKARLDFSYDAKLSAIYGWNVDENGNVDLLETDNAYVYVVQSDLLQENAFYVPVFAAGPIESPIDFNTMLSFVKDSTASNRLDRIFGRLSTLAIDPNANYNDSPATVDTALVHGGNDFIALNDGAKIDMFLVPSKSIDTTLALNNSADWIVNFYSNNKSLVLWINSNSGVVTKLSGN